MFLLSKGSRARALSLQQFLRVEVSVIDCLGAFVHRLLQIGVDRGFVGLWKSLLLLQFVVRFKDLGLLFMVD